MGIVLKNNAVRQRIVPTGHEVTEEKYQNQSITNGSKKC
jgi:hypothetical protein